jgi:hypothetical protein
MQWSADNTKTLDRWKKNLKHRGQSNEVTVNNQKRYKK